MEVTNKVENLSDEFNSKSVYKGINESDFKKRIIWIDYDIDSKINLISRQILNWNSEDYNIKSDKRIPIQLFINSYGGSLAETLALVDIMQCSMTPIYTVNVSCAFSSASLILLAGKKRYGAI